MNAAFLCMPHHFAVETGAEAPVAASGTSTFFAESGISFACATN